MFSIDEEKFDDGVRKLCERIPSSQNNAKNGVPTKVHFNNGWLGEQEFYKHSIWERAQDILEFKTWSKDRVLSLGLVERVIKCMDMKIEPGSKQKQNLLDWRDIDKVKKVFSDKKEHSELVIYNIFCDDNEERAFNGVKELLGNSYPITSFFFFLKDKNRFLPVRPYNMKRKLQAIGITTDCLNKSSWRNYNEFIQIIREVQRRIQPIIDPNADLIDTHSFVWALWLLEEEIREDPLAAEFQTIDSETSQLFGDVREAVVKTRINQSEFRKRLLNRYSKCCLCGVSNEEFLLSSHIKPWSKSNRSERLDVDNGLLLCPNHDRLFDQGYISFSDNGDILISDDLSQIDQTLMNVRRGMHIDLSEGNKSYLSYHRKLFSARNLH